MAGPWEDFAAAPAAPPAAPVAQPETPPWEDFSQPAQAEKAPWEDYGAPPAPEAPPPQEQSGVFGTFRKEAAKGALDLFASTAEGIGLGVSKIRGEPTTDSSIYQAGLKLKKYAETWGASPEELAAHPWAAFAGSNVGASGAAVTGALVAAPALAATSLVGPEAAAIGTGAALFGLSSAGSTYDEAVAKGADDMTAAKAAGLSGLAGGALGALPLGVVLSPMRKAAPGLLGWGAVTLEKAVRAGITFATVGEAQEFLGRQIAKEFYDPNAGYSFDANRAMGALIGGGIIGTLTPAQVREHTQPKPKADVVNDIIQAANIQENPVTPEGELTNPAPLRPEPPQAPPEAEAIIKRMFSGDKQVPPDVQALAEDRETDPGVDMARMARLLGPKLYGSPEDIQAVSVKEMFQNAFDAIKGAGTDGDGRIDLTVNPADRSISMLDNGSGMTPEILGGKFLQIAGTHKETDKSSGGLGIAKMLFLYGNKEIHVTTMRNGVVSQLKTTGEELMNALRPGGKKPSLQVYTRDELSPSMRPHIDTLFPEGRGTFIQVKTPDSFRDPSTGEMKPISFSSYQYGLDHPPVLEHSPLFRNIQVKVNGRPLKLGAQFPYPEFQQFRNINFDWGNARLYVSNEDNSSWGYNFHTLSNGLWQFSQSLRKNPMQAYGDNIPRTFYLDVQPKVQPDEPGYPFDLNRQGFSAQVKDDMQKIMNYVSTYFRQQEFNTSAKNFGRVEYLERPRGQVVSSEAKDLAPPIPETDLPQGVTPGENMVVKDGQLFVDGKQIPELTKDDLKNAALDVSQLRIPQKEVDPNKVMIHDNLEIDVGITGKTKIGDILSGTVKSQRMSVVEYGRMMWGSRFNDFMYGMGDLFRTMRNEIADAMSEYVKVSKDAQNRLIENSRASGVTDYQQLKDRAVGLSFDIEYRGVSIPLPFYGEFLNVGLPEVIDPSLTGGAYVGTMLHEIGHTVIRNEERNLPHVQSILNALGPQKLTAFYEHADRVVQAHFDIVKGLNDAILSGNPKPIGLRFKDGLSEAVARRDSEGVAEPRGAARSARSLFARAKSGAERPANEQRPQGVRGTVERAISDANRGALIENEHGRAIVNGWEIEGARPEQIEGVTHGLRLPEVPTREDLVRLAERASASDRAQLANWIPKVKEKLGRMGEAIAQECLGRGGRFTIR